MLFSTVEKKNGMFWVSTVSGKKYRSYALIVATGMQRRMSNVPGERRLLRRGVSYVLSQGISIFADRSMAVRSIDRKAALAAMRYLLKLSPRTRHNSE